MKRDDYFVKALQDELESKADILDTAYKAQLLSSEGSLKRSAKR